MRRNNKSFSMYSSNFDSYSILPTVTLLLAKLPSGMWNLSWNVSTTHSVWMSPTINTKKSRKALSNQTANDFDWLPVTLVNYLMVKLKLQATSDDFSYLRVLSDDYTGRAVVSDNSWWLLILSYHYTQICRLY